MKSKLHWAALAVCGATALGLAGCGGGGGGDDHATNTTNNGSPGNSGGGTPTPVTPPVTPGATSSIKGVWFGTGTNGSRTQSARLVILDDGTLWGALVPDDPTSGIGVDGVLHASESVLHGTTKTNDKNVSASFTQFDIRFDAQPLTKTGMGFSGSAVDPDNLNLAFDSGLSLPVKSDASYATAASLTTLASSYNGRIITWKGSALSMGPTSLTVSGPTLSVSADSKGCSASGTLAPRASMNVFDLSLTYSGTSCALGDGATVKGVAYPVGESKTLELIATTSDGKYAIFFDGTPQQ